MHSQSRSGLEADAEKADDARGLPAPHGSGAAANLLRSVDGPRASAARTGRERPGRQKVKFAHDNAANFSRKSGNCLRPGIVAVPRRFTREFLAARGNLQAEDAAEIHYVADFLAELGPTMAR